MIRAAADTFDITPQLNAETSSATGATVRNVFSPLKTTVTLLEDERQLICLITSHFVEEYCSFSNLRRGLVADVLGISRDQVFVFVSHNHSDVVLGRNFFQHGIPQMDALFKEEDLTDEGKLAVQHSVEAAARLKDKLVPVRIRWAVGRERRITYNRKGRRADGSTYLMREEDRLLLGQDFNGDIDDEAPVVEFSGMDGKPVCFLVQFTGHPATAYHPEDPVVFGEYPQVACDDLSNAFEGVPVGFLQGCAGEVNSKGLVSAKPVAERINDATRYGHYLGQTYIEAASRLRPSERENLALAWNTVRLPFRRVPAERKLRAMLTVVEDFLQRCARGDENTLLCAGLNFPAALSFEYRAKLALPLKRWAEWALSFHLQGRLHEAPSFVECRVGTIRIGDVAIVGMFGEPFLGIGRQIKRQSPLPLTIPCGYMHDSALAYIPDAPNNGDPDYQSSFYRYTTSLLPYRNPAGDLLAHAAMRSLKKLAKR
jgi:hypothetical protein